MTLRLGLLIVSLFILAVIGLVCHYQFRQHEISKRRINRLPGVKQDEVSTPFFTQREADNEDLQLKPADDLGDDADSKTQLEPFVNYVPQDKRAKQNLLAELLPVYSADELITDYVAVLPGFPVSSSRVREILESSKVLIGKPVLAFACDIQTNNFIPLNSFSATHQITHLKLQIQLKDKFETVDKEMLSNFETLVADVSEKLDRETHYAISSEQALNAIQELDAFTRENELIITLYILAQPEGKFNGATINRVLLEEGLNYGKFKFFHYFSTLNKSEKIYSVANMFKPGSFELDELDQLSTMGLCAYMLPALQTQPLESFKVMCETLAKVSEKLDGVLTTNQRELLDAKNYLEISKQITAHIDKLKARGIMPASDLAKRFFD